jgi:molybdenum cofactor biosynthesis enzyme MoaA
MEITPSLTIAVTTTCNLRCVYCPPFGESLEAVAEDQDQLESLLPLVRSGGESGLRVLRLTGGEPLLLLDSTLQLLEAGVESGYRRVILNTNGTLLARTIGALTPLKNAFECKVSLDTVDRQAYEVITGRDSLPDVLRGLDAATACGFKVVINCVVSAQSLAGLPDLLEYVDRMGLDLKLFDVQDFQGHLEGARHLVADSGRVIGLLRRRYGDVSYQRLDSGRGIPMALFKTQDDREVLFVQHQVAHDCTYGQLCRECEHFPCQTGLIGVFAWSDGCVSPCRARRDLAIQCSAGDVRQMFSSVLAHYAAGTFHESSSR